MESSVGAQYIALARQEDNTMNYCMLYQITPDAAVARYWALQ